ncbi:hypothetical protein FRAAL3252 [Frankia alni ACN14a]|uniref:Uncharacterized protein n=1 Tax=Frankia alni (strain DSM 45986 / CECT 9034 / ACN14a) TaxID=326424 RepID=Q0RKQ9_FRAAA|nr:hypothetical protein FRAAL3252 [Frankia alni ACN14a]
MRGGLRPWERAPGRPARGVPSPALADRPGGAAPCAAPMPTPTGRQVTSKALKQGLTPVTSVLREGKEVPRRCVIPRRLWVYGSEDDRW